jgi:hypothetical protein
MDGLFGGVCHGQSFGAAAAAVAARSRRRVTLNRNKGFEGMAAKSTADVLQRDARDPNRNPEADIAAYLIWSNEHEAWWGPGEMGYVLNVAHAGRYRREHAIAICKRALFGRHKGLPFPELAILERDALDCTTMEFR